MTKKIEITVAPDGQSKVETQDFSGAECREASKFIEQALGQRSAETLKPEFHQSATTQQQIQQGE